ncbi:hypothetical protein Emag_002611 [Eimeria magna]
MPADSLEILVSRSAASCSFLSSSSSEAALPAASREAPQESLHQAYSSSAQQQQHQLSCDGNGKAAAPAVPFYVERHNEGLSLSEQGHHPFFPLFLKWQKDRSELYSCSSSSSRSSKSSRGRDSSTSTRATSSIDSAFFAEKASAGAAATIAATSKSAELFTSATAATAATAVTLTPPPSVIAAVAITATTTAETAAKTTKAPRSKAAPHAAFEAPTTSRLATTPTLAGARNRDFILTQREKAVQPSRPVCMHAICCGILPLSEQNSREARSCICFDPAVGAIAASLASHTSATDVAAGVAEAEVAAESPLRGKGNHQADGLEDITQEARLRRAIIAPTGVKRLGTCAAPVAAAAPALAEEGFASRKRQRHNHQEEQLCSPNAAAAAAATTSCSSPQRSSSLSLLPAVSLPLLQQPRQQQGRKPCVVASELTALRVTSARAATALPRAAVAETAFHDKAASPQSSFSYERALTSSVVVSFAADEGQEVYNASSIAAEASTVAAGVAAPRLDHSSAAQEKFTKQVAASVTATGHSQLQQTINSNAVPLVAASAAGSSSQLPSRCELAANRLLRSACQTSVTATSADNSVSTGSTNADKQAHSSTSSSTSNSNLAHQEGISVHKKLLDRCELGSLRTPWQQHQQQQKISTVQISALRRSLLQHQMKRQRLQKRKRLLPKRPNTALHQGLSYNSYCSKCRSISGRAIVKAASPEQKRSSSTSVIGSSDHSCTSRGSLRGDKGTSRADSYSTLKGRSGSSTLPEEGRNSLPPHEAAGAQRAPVTDSRRSVSSCQSAAPAGATAAAAAAVTSPVTLYAKEGLQCDGGSQAAAAAAAAAKAAADAADAAAALAAATVVRAATVAATLEAASAAMTSPAAVAPDVGAAAQASLKTPESAPLTAETATYVKCTSSKSSSCCWHKTGHDKGVNFGCFRHCSPRGGCAGCKSSEEPQQHQQHQQHQQRDGKRRRPLSSSANLLSQACGQQTQVQLSHSRSSHCQRFQGSDSGTTSMRSKRFLVVAKSASAQGSSALKDNSGTIAVAYAGARASATEPEQGLKTQLRCSKHPRKLPQAANDVHLQQQSRYRDKLAKMRHQLQEQQLLLQEEQRKHALQRPPWNNRTSTAAGEASRVSPQPRGTMKLPAEAVELISARLYERARQQTEIRELRRQLHQQQQQLVLLQGIHKDLPGCLPGCHSNSDNRSIKRGLAAEGKNVQPIELQHERRVLQQLHQVSLRQQQQQQAQGLQDGPSSRNSEELTRIFVARSPQNKKDKDVAAQQHHHLHVHSESMSTVRQHSALTQHQRQQEKDSVEARFAPQSKAADTEKSDSSSRQSSSGKNEASTLSSDRKQLRSRAPNDHEQQQREQQRQQDQPQPQQLGSLNMHILRLHLRLQDQIAGPKKPKNGVLPDEQHQKQQHQQQLTLLRQQKQQQNQQLLQLQQYLQEERLLHQQDMQHYAQQLQQLEQQIQQLQVEKSQETRQQKQLHLRKTLHCGHHQRVPTPPATTPKKSICTKKADLSLFQASTLEQNEPTTQGNSSTLNGRRQISSCGAVPTALAPDQLQKQGERATTEAAAAAVGKLDWNKEFDRFNSNTWSEGEIRNSTCLGRSMQELYLLDELQQQVQPWQQHQRKPASSTVDLPLEGAEQCLIRLSESERQRRGAALPCSTSSRRRITYHLTESRLEQQEQRRQKHTGNPRLAAGDSTSLLLQLRKLFGNTNGQQQPEQQQQQEEPEGALSLQDLRSAELRDAQERRVAALLQRHFVVQQKQQQDQHPRHKKPQPAKLTFGYGIEAGRRSPLGTRSFPLTASIRACASAVTAGLSNAGAKELQWVGPAAAAQIDSHAARNAHAAGRRRCDTRGLFSEGPVISRQQQQWHQSTPQEFQPTHVIRGSSSKAHCSQQALRSDSPKSSQPAALESVQQPQQSQRLQQQQQKRQPQIEKGGRVHFSPRHSQQQQMRETSHEQQQPWPDPPPQSLITSQQQNQRQLPQQMPQHPMLTWDAQRGRLGLSQQQLLLPDIAVDVPQHQQEFLHDPGVTNMQQQPLHVIKRRNTPH